MTPTKTTHETSRNTGSWQKNSVTAASLFGCGGHLASLRRTQSGKFTVDKAIRFEDLKTLPRADLARHVLPMLAAME